MSPYAPSRFSLLALAVLQASCRSDKPADDAAAPPASAAGAEQTASAGKPHVVTVVASDYTFDAPAEVPAGLTAIRLVNRGPSLHHIQLMRLDEGKTLDDFLAALKGDHPPTWAVVAGGPAPPEVGDTTTTIEALQPGTYALICFIPAKDGMPHVMKGMSHEMKVVAPARAAAPPEADVVVTLVDYDFQLSQPLKAGKHTIRVENTASQPHEIAIVRLGPGKRPGDFAAWGMKPVGPQPGTIHGGVSGIMPGAHSFVELDLPPGDYGLLCFIPDAKDGKPHFEHGMMKTIKVAS
jgi:uncharacterized lipoprotein YbaY